MDPSSLLYVVSGLLVLVGLAGIVLPALPGVPLMFAGMLLAAWANGFERVGAVTLSILGAFTLLSVLADFWATAIGAKRVGASRSAIVGAVVGTFVGLFFSLPGLLFGPFIGAMTGELIHGRRIDRERFGLATRVGIGTWVGILFAIALKLALAFAMLGVFALAWLA